METFPKSPVRGDSEVALTKCNENRDLENRVRSELPELHTIKKEQPTQKFMGCERKVTQKEG